MWHFLISQTLQQQYITYWRQYEMARWNVSTQISWSMLTNYNTLSAQYTVKVEMSKAQSISLLQHSLSHTNRWIVCGITVPSSLTFRPFLRSRSLKNSVLSLIIRLIETSKILPLLNNYISENAINSIHAKMPSVYGQSTKTENQWIKED